jgi:hypothetical protein
MRYPLWCAIAARKPWFRSACPKEVCTCPVATDLEQVMSGLLTTTKLPRPGFPLPAKPAGESPSWATWLEPIRRIAIFVIYFWFGFLTLPGLSPATPLAAALTHRTIGAQYYNASFKALTGCECGVGIILATVAVGIIARKGTPERRLSASSRWR